MQEDVGDGQTPAKDPVARSGTNGNFRIRGAARCSPASRTAISNAPHTLAVVDISMAGQVFHKGPNRQPRPCDEGSGIGFTRFERTPTTRRAFAELQLQRQPLGNQRGRSPYSRPVVDVCSRGSAARGVVGDIGSLLFVPAVLAMTALTVAALSGEWFAVPGFAVVGVGAASGGAALRRVGGRARAGGIQRAMATVALGWVLVALVAAVPLLLAARLGEPATIGSAGVFADPWSAVFEGMSGFTSTGLTMVTQEGRLPHSLQWWRSVLQWTGGAGVVLLVLAVADGDRGYQLYEAEGRSRLLRDDVHATARRIWKILLGLTAFSVLLLLIAGASPWVALNHGLTGISTGGMVVTDDSFRGTPAAVRAAGVVVMVLGAVSYGAYGLLLHGRASEFLRLTQIRLLLGSLAGGALAVTLTLRLSGTGPGFLDATFTWVSAVTTCGFAATDVSALPTAAVVLLLAAMFVGGSAGSTTGGIKLRRAAWLLRAAARAPELLDGSGAVDRPWRYDGRAVSSQQGARAVATAGALVLGYLLTLTVGTVLLALSIGPPVPLRQVLFETLSALNTVGLTSGVTSSDLPWHGKAVLVVLMWAGRLEVVAVAVLVLGPLRSLARRRPESGGRSRALT